MSTEVQGCKVEISGRVPASLHHLVAPKVEGHLLGFVMLQFRSEIDKPVSK